MGDATLLVDGDILVYKHAYAEQHVVEWDEDLVTTFARFEPAFASLCKEIDDLRNTTHTDEVKVALSCPTDEGYRRQVDRTYKQGRDGQVRPLLYGKLRNALLQEPDAATVLPRLEGDDVLGLWATGRVYRGRCIIATIDKDLLTIPGRHIKLGDPDAKVVEVSADEAERFFMLQCLTGDPTDGYGGCPGIGPVRAARLLSVVPPGGSLFEVGVVPAYRKAGLDRTAAISTARLARVLRAGDYNRGTHKVRLWGPTKGEVEWI